MLNFDAQQDTIGASFTLVDMQDGDPTLAGYHLSFGYDPITGGVQRGAYVDDDKYGATGTNNPNGNVVVTDSANLITIDNDSPDDNFMYFFGSELALQTSFFAAGHQPCVCKFLEWGYWGGRRDWFDPAANQTRTDFFHLGTWVAGNISNEVDLPTSGTAAFAGHAVGSVTRDISGVDHQYIAGGGFDMTWDFAARNGTATISDFDGFTVSGGMTSISPPATLTPNTFVGPLSGGGLNGNLSGSFVSGPLSTAQGVIGSFDLMGTGFSATGIVAGEQ